MCTFIQKFNRQEVNIDISRDIDNEKNTAELNIVHLRATHNYIISVEEIIERSLIKEVTCFVLNESLLLNKLFG